MSNHIDVEVLFVFWFPEIQQKLINFGHEFQGSVAAAHQHPTALTCSGPEALRSVGRLQRLDSAFPVRTLTPRTTRSAEVRPTSDWVKLSSLKVTRGRIRSEYGPESHQFRAKSTPTGTKGVSSGRITRDHVRSL